MVYPDAEAELVRGQLSGYKRQLKEATGQPTEFNRRFPKGCLSKANDSSTDPTDVEATTHTFLENIDDGEADGEEDINDDREGEEEGTGGQGDGDFLDLEFRFNEGDEERDVSGL